MAESVVVEARGMVSPTSWNRACHNSGVCAWALRSGDERVGLYTSTLLFLLLQMIDDSGRDGGWTFHLMFLALRDGKWCVVVVAGCNPVADRTFRGLVDVGQRLDVAKRGFEVLACSFDYIGCS